ncbi:hypothetical protein [Sedimentitalea sp.]|uniref:hypothetical protein n=1 Tax=Sedimentitalea sp. TaxID=2048915 RepID=UPI003299CADD
MPNSDTSEENYTSLLFMIGVAVVIAFSIYLVGVESDAVKFKLESDGSLPGIFWSALMILAALSVLMERAIEVLLNASRRNVEPVFDAENRRLVEGPSVRPEAAMIGIALGVVIAASGVRVLDTLVEFTVCTTAIQTDCVTENAWYLFRFADIALTAGILAGGADGLHPMINALVEFGVKLQDRARGIPQRNRFDRVRDPKRFHELQGIADVRSFKITVDRGAGTSGTLTFQNGGVSVSATCYWDPDNRIPAGTYLRCSKTRMTNKTDPEDPTKKRMGIYLPDAKSVVTGAADIFIHEGKDESWSDGCIVIPRTQMQTVWDTIAPMNGFNVTVVVRDVS